MNDDGGIGGEIIQAATATGTVRIEVRAVGREKVAQQAIQFAEFRESLKAIAMELYTAIDAISPTKASIEFGIEAALEAGGLVAVLVKGSSKANLKVTMEWSKS